MRPLICLPCLCPCYPCYLSHTDPLDGGGRGGQVRGLENRPFSCPTVAAAKPLPSSKCDPEPTLAGQIALCIVACHQWQQKKNTSGEARGGGLRRRFGGAPWAPASGLGPIRPDLPPPTPPSQPPARLQPGVVRDTIICMYMLCIAIGVSKPRGGAGVGTQRDNAGDTHAQVRRKGACAPTHAGDPFCPVVKQAVRTAVQCRVDVRAGFTVGWRPSIRAAGIEGTVGVETIATATVSQGAVGGAGAAQSQYGAGSRGTDRTYGDWQTLELQGPPQLVRYDRNPLGLVRPFLVGKTGSGGTAVHRGPAPSVNPCPSVWAAMEEGCSIPAASTQPATLPAAPSAASVLKHRSRLRSPE